MQNPRLLLAREQVDEGLSHVEPPFGQGFCHAGLFRRDVQVGFVEARLALTEQQQRLFDQELVLAYGARAQAGYQVHAAVAHGRVR